MAHQPYRPAPSGVPAGGGFAAPPPLQFVASSFSAEAQQSAASGAGGSFAAAYPPPSGFGGAAGGGSFGLPQTSYGAPPVGGFVGGASASFDDEPPLLEGARALASALPCAARAHAAARVSCDARAARWHAAAQSWASTCRTCCARRAPCCAHSEPTLRCVTTATCQARCCSPSRSAAATCWRVACAHTQIGLRWSTRQLSRPRAPQMGKVNFGYILGWSVMSMLALHWLVNMLAGPAQARGSVLESMQGARAGCLVHTHSHACARATGHRAIPLRLLAGVLLAAHRALFCCRCLLASQARPQASPRAQRPQQRATMRLTPRCAHVSFRGITACVLGALATLWSSSTASKLLTTIVPALEVCARGAARAGRRARAVVALLSAHACAPRMIFVSPRRCAGPAHACGVPLLFGVRLVCAVDARLTWQCIAVIHVRCDAQRAKESITPVLRD